jgi:hypothetical protein
MWARSSALGGVRKELDRSIREQRQGWLFHPPRRQHDRHPQYSVAAATQRQLLRRRKLNRPELAEIERHRPAAWDGASCFGGDSARHPLKGQHLGRIWAHHGKSARCVRRGGGWKRGTVEIV